MKENKQNIGITTEAYKELKDFITSNKYTSLNQINNHLIELGYKYSNETVKKYLQQLKKEKIIYSAGRGYYSINSKEFVVESTEHLNLIHLVKTKYPLLEFSFWSTKMLAGLFHHTQNQFYTFIYAESDTLLILRDFLIDNGNDAILNPSKNEKNVILKNNLIILRPSITRSKSQDHISSVEKILVDLFVESNRLNLIDSSEYEIVFETMLNSYRVDVSYIIDYAERRKSDGQIKELLNKYTNATFVE